MLRRCNSRLSRSHSMPEDQHSALPTPFASGRRLSLHLRCASTLPKLRHASAYRWFSAPCPCIEYPRRAPANRSPAPPCLCAAVAYPNTTLPQLFHAVPSCATALPNYPMPRHRLAGSLYATPSHCYASALFGFPVLRPSRGASIRIFALPVLDMAFRRFALTGHASSRPRRACVCNASAQLVSAMLTRYGSILCRCPTVKRFAFAHRSQAMPCQC